MRHLVALPTRPPLARYPLPATREIIFLSKHNVVRLGVTFAPQPPPGAGRDPRLTDTNCLCQLFHSPRSKVHEQIFRLQKVDKVMWLYSSGGA